MDLQLHDPVDLTALADRTASVRYERLVGVVAEHDVVVGELVDEELLLCAGGGEPGSRDPDPVWTPYLAGLPADHRAVSVDTALRMDVAQEMIGPARHHRDAWSPLLSAVAHGLERACAQVTWRFSVGQDGPYPGAALVLAGGVVLHDDIDDLAGQHVVVFRSAEREAGHVLAKLDPELRSPVDAAGADPGGPTPHLATLQRGARSVSTLTRGPVWESDRQERVLRAYGRDDGLWLVEQHPDGGGPVTTVQRRSREDLRALARELLAAPA